MYGILRSTVICMLTSGAYCIINLRKNLTVKLRAANKRAKECVRKTDPAEWCGGIRVLWALAYHDKNNERIRYRPVFPSTFGLNKPCYFISFRIVPHGDTHAEEHWTRFVSTVNTSTTCAHLLETGFLISSPFSFFVLFLCVMRIASFMHGNAMLSHRRIRFYPA